MPVDERVSCVIAAWRNHVARRSRRRQVSRHQMLLDCLSQSARSVRLFRPSLQKDRGEYDNPAFSEGTHVSVAGSQREADRLVDAGETSQLAGASYLRST